MRSTSVVSLWKGGLHIASPEAPATSFLSVDSPRDLRPRERALSQGVRPDAAVRGLVPPIWFGHRSPMTPALGANAVALPDIPNRSDSWAISSGIEISAGNTVAPPNVLVRASAPYAAIWP